VNKRGRGQEQKLAEEPKYLLKSVDNALELLQILRDRGQIRVATAADILGVSRSTTHRLLKMLEYRGFAIQDENRVYMPGHGMNVALPSAENINKIANILDPSFKTFVNEIQETVSLVARYGTTLRFIDTYVPSDVAAISSRQGIILPAHQTSGGKILLSFLQEQVLQSLYRSNVAKRANVFLTLSEFNSLLRELSLARESGFATNMAKTERGVYAISMAIQSAGDMPWLAFALAMPHSRRGLIHDRKLLGKCKAFQISLNQQLNEEL